MFKVNFIVTNDCNASMLPPTKGAPDVCSFCFRPIEKIETDKVTIKKIFEGLEKLSFMQPLVFTGGEPLVSPYISYILQEAYKKGYSISLHTNGLLLNQMEAEIMPFVKYLSLPYDGHTPQLADYYRGKGYFEICQTSMQIALAHNVKIGLHTLVTPFNYSHLMEMSDSLIKSNIYSHLWYWYIKKYRKINFAADVLGDEYEMEEQIYRNSVQNVRIRLDQANFDIYESGQIEKTIVTFFVYANGNVYSYFTGNKANTFLGNVCSENWGNVVKRYEKLHNAAIIT